MANERALEEMSRRQRELADEAWRQTDDATWTRLWDERADLALRAAELAEQDGEGDQALAWRRVVENSRVHADQIRERPSNG